MPTIDKIILLASFGALFALYLSSVKFFTQGCSVLSSCSFIWGIPTCYFGLLFFALSLMGALAYKFCSWGGVKMKTARLHFLRTSLALGLIFALYSSYLGFAQMIASKQVAGLLILPSCAYGAVLFAVVLYLSFKLANSQEGLNNTDTEDEKHIA